MHNVDNRLESLSVSEPSIEPTPHDEALELLLRCAAQVFHCKIVEVTQEQIVDPRTEYLFYLSVDTSNRTLFSAAKEICENIDGRSDHFRGRYTKITHPEVKAYARQFAGKPVQYYSSIHSAMHLLEYLCELPDFRLRRPYDIPTELIRREHLLKYRQHLLRRVQNGEISAESAKRDLGRATSFMRDAQSTRTPVLSIDFTGITIWHSENRQRRLPTHIAVELVTNRLVVHPTRNRGIILFILLACATGARPGELLNLKLVDIDPVEQAVWLKSKTDQGRWVPLPKYLWQYLWVEARGRSDSEPILRNTRGKPLRYASLERLLVSKSSDLRDTIDGAVAFRHLFATACMAANVPTDITIYLMGHASPDALTRYQKSEHSFARQEVNRAFESWGESE